MEAIVHGSTDVVLSSEAALTPLWNASATRRVLGNDGKCIMEYEEIAFSDRAPPGAQRMRRLHYARQVLMVSLGRFCGRSFLNTKLINDSQRFVTT